MTYPKLPVPGFTNPTKTHTPTEILASTHALVKQGCTLAGGQGILPAGTVLGYKTSNKKYYVYDNSASDGTEVARGILLEAVDTNADSNADQLAVIVVAGVLKNSKLSGADSSAITDLNARQDTVRDLFIF